jgi:hypothetical protein
MQRTLAEEDTTIRRSGTHGFNSLELFRHRYSSFAAYIQMKIYFQSIPVDF